MKYYTAYVLTDETIEMLKERFPPKYPDFLGHHITVEFDVPSDTPLPPDVTDRIEVIGFKDSGDGLQVLVVSIKGSTKRPDGSWYHITWSLDFNKYNSVDSNTLLRDTEKKYILTMPKRLKTVPALLNVLN